MASRTIELPQQVLAVDCALQTSDAASRGSVTDHTLRLACAVYRDYKSHSIEPYQRLIATEPGEFWHRLYEIGRRDEPLWIVGHRISTTLLATEWFGEMDAERITLLPSDPADRKRLKRDPLFVLEDPPIIAVCWDKSSRKLIIVDLQNYLRAGAADTAALVGAKVVTNPPDTWSISDVARATEHRATVWLRAFDQIRGWVKSECPVTMGYSAASQSFLNYRIWWQRTPICNDKPDWVKYLEGESLYTGRVEILDPEPVLSTVHHFDVRSFYPWVMLTNEFPHALEDCGNSHMVPMKICWAQWENAVARVTISPSRHDYPIRKRGVCRYRRGEFTTVLAGPELVRAIREGIVIKIHEWARYKVGPIFSDWAKWILDLRMRHRLGGNKTWDRWVKLQSNALYGKFAERRYTWERCDKPPTAPDWGFHQIWNADKSRHETYKVIAGNCWMRGNKEYLPHAFPAIAAFVTSFGRVHMDNLIDRIGRHHVLYRAVDSLFVDNGGFARVGQITQHVGNGPGSLVLVKSASGFHARAINCYSHGGEVTQQGLKVERQDVGDGMVRIRQLESLIRTLGRQPSGVVRMTDEYRRLGENT